MSQSPFIPGEEDDPQKWLDNAIEEAKGEIAQVKAYEKLFQVKPLPSQQRYLDAVNNPAYFLVLMLAPNQSGKSFIHTYDLLCESFGYQPHDGKRRRHTPYAIALVVPDYENHARKFLHQNIYLQPSYDGSPSGGFLPPECVKVETNSTGAPRVIWPTDPRTGKQGKPIHIFTHDQKPMALEGGTWQRIACDEPPPRSHVVAMIRGLQQTGGKLSMTMTLLQEPWIFEDIYERAQMNGGERADYFCITAGPDENLQSKGGYLEDERVQSFRDFLTEEEADARVHGRSAVLSGQAIRAFNPSYHVLPDSEVEERLDPYRDKITGRIDLPLVLSVDPHPRQCHAMGWYYLTPDDTMYVWDEYPEDEFHRINARTYTYEFYVKEVIFKRPPPTLCVMDPNAGRTPNDVNGLMVFEEYGRYSRPDFPLGFDTGVNDELMAKLQAIHERLVWDKSKPISASNRPHLYIAQRCHNHIHNLRHCTWDNYRGRTADLRAKKPTLVDKYKHFIDILGYACGHPMFRHRILERHVTAAHTAYERDRLTLGWRPRLNDPTPADVRERPTWESFIPERARKGTSYGGRI